MNTIAFKYEAKQYPFTFVHSCYIDCQLLMNNIKDIVIWNMSLFYFDKMLHAHCIMGNFGEHKIWWNSFQSLLAKLKFGNLNALAP